MKKTLRQDPSLFLNPSGTEAMQISLTRPGWWFMCLLFLAVFAMATPFDPSFAINGNAGLTLSEEATKIASGSLSRQVALVTLGTFGIAALLFRRSRNRIEPNGVLGYVAIFFLFLSALSVIVSDDIMFTAKRVTVLLTLTLGVLATTTRMNLRRIITFAVCAGIFSLGAGFLCEVASGTFKPFVGSYRFAGVLDANFQASNCSMLLLAAVASAHAAKRQRIRIAYFGIAVLSRNVSMKMRHFQETFSVPPHHSSGTVC